MGGDSKSTFLVFFCYHYVAIYQYFYGITFVLGFFLPFYSKMANQCQQVENWSFIEIPLII